MLLVNDDINNDELFRRAAEHYPLKTEGADWEAVLAKINAAGHEPQQEPVPPKRNKNYRYLLLLLLLIPFAIYESRKSTETKTIQPGNSSSNQAAINTNTDKNAGQTVLADDNSKQTNTGGTTADETSDNKPQATTNSTAPNKNSISSAASVPVTQDNTVSNAVKEHNDATVSNHNSTSTDKTTAVHKRKSKGKSSIRIKNAAAASEDEEVVTVNYPVKKEKNNSVTAKTKGKKNVSIVAAEASDDAIENKEPGSLETTKTEPVTTTVPAEEKKQEEKNVTTKEPVKPNEKTTEKTVAKNEKKNKTLQKHFYAGLIAGPDFSTVKLQSVKKTGLEFGLIVGYRFNNKISIETGFIRDKKYYNTDGKYFDTKSMYMSYPYTIQYAKGGCDMWELPISFRYTFSSNAKRTWFGSLGTSSYFMRHESYVFDVTYNGYRYPKSYDYDNRSTSMFAALNISGGLTYKLGRFADLRVEPYIKLPINKLGTGKLPVQSAGIYLGLTKDIF